MRVDTRKVDDRSSSTVSVVIEQRLDRLTQHWTMRQDDHYKEVAPAVEQFGQPSVVDGYEVTRFVVQHGEAVINTTE